MRPDANISTWSYDMEGHAKKCVERYCELASTTTQQLYKIASPCLDDHQFKEEELGSVGELKKCLYLARIGRPYILWSVNKLARAVTKWIRACDKRLARLISYIHHTSDFQQYCHVGNTAQQCRVGLFQDSDFAGDLEDSKSTQGESCVCLEVTRGCVRNEIQFHTVRRNLKLFLLMDEGLRMDEITALDLWDLVIEVLHSSHNQPRKSKVIVQGDLLRNKPSRKHTNSQTKTQIHYNDLELANVDSVS